MTTKSLVLCHMNEKCIIYIMCVIELAIILFFNNIFGKVVTF